MSHYSKKGIKENEPELGKAKRKLFPFSLKKIDKSFSYFLLKIIFVLFFVMITLYFSLSAYRDFVQGKHSFLLYFYTMLLALDLYVLIHLVFQYFRYTQVIFRFFKKNPLLNEKTATFLLAGVNNQVLEVNEEPDFYKKQKEFQENWKTLGELLFCILLFLPRLFILAFTSLIFYIKVRYKK